MGAWHKRHNYYFRHRWNEWICVSNIATSIHRRRKRAIYARTWKSQIPLVWKEQSWINNKHYNRRRCWKYKRYGILRHFNQINQFAEQCKKDRKIFYCKLCRAWKNNPFGQYLRNSDRCIQFRLQTYINRIADKINFNRCIGIFKLRVIGKYRHSRHCNWNWWQSIRKFRIANACNSKRCDRG